MNAPEDMKPVDEVVNIAVADFCATTTNLVCELERRLQEAESRLVKLELEVDACRDCVGCLDALAADTKSVKEKLAQLLLMKRRPPTSAVN
jgi:hypothetical protein